MDISQVSDLQFDDLVVRYMGLVRALSRKYYLPGGDWEDVLQEGLMGLYKAARDYDPEGKSSFRSFAAKVIERQLISALKTARRGKAMVLTRAERFEAQVQKNRYANVKELGELIASGAADPLDKIIAQEDAASFWGRVKNTLSPLEMDVLKCYIAGYSMRETAISLSCTTKAVDNALTRVKNKFRTDIANSAESAG